jgi:TonB-dependent SusC/RagA subfamily outer membrane receptor
MGLNVIWKVGLSVLFLAPSIVGAQDRRISGTVTRSGTTMPLVDVEVTVLGQTRIAPVRTSAEGRYTISAPAGVVRLQARLIGYTRVEVTVPVDRSTVDFALVQDVFKLGEVVVSGQATTIERRSATTSIALVTGDELGKVPAPTIESALNGRITGVNLQSNPAPRGGVQCGARKQHHPGRLRSALRGGRIMYSNASVPSGRGLANAAANPSTEADAVNRVADLNPADIASIEVLKGAAASSIYGSKAANGVVVITTTRGQSGAPRFNLTQRVGVFTPLRLMDSRRWTLDSALASFGEEARPYFQGNSSPFFDNAATIYDNRKPSYETIADVSGGNQSTRYYVSGSVKRDEGIERATGFTRQGIRLNLDQVLSPTMDVKVSSVFNRAEHDRGWNNNCNNYGVTATRCPISRVSSTSRSAIRMAPFPTRGAGSTRTPSS